MKKTKKTVSPKKSNIGANKKSLKTGVKAKSETSKEEEYPVWTMPEHLSENDHEALKNVHRLHKEGKFDIALNFASNLDTVVRDAIPADIWKEIGGKLIHEKDEMQETGSDNDEPVSPQSSITGSQRFFILKHGVLEHLPAEYFSNPEKRTQLIENKFQTKRGLKELVIANSTMLFGKDTVVIENKTNPVGYFPNIFLFVFRDAEKPRLYLLEPLVGEQSPGNIFAHITHFISLLKNKKHQPDFLAKLSEIIAADEIQLKKLGDKFPATTNIPDLLPVLLKNKPSILLITDEEKADLPILQETYTDTWGNMVRQILIKEYACGKDVIYTTYPDFAGIWKDKKSRKQETVTSTEEEHLEAASGISGKIYNEIKKALLETDSGLEFNPKKHYISVRKDKNLAFLQLKKKITLVVMNPEEDTRACIKHHLIKTLPDSVQKFWNGQCCTIVIENTDNLIEVIDLLKKIVKNA